MCLEIFACALHVPAGLSGTFEAYTVDGETVQYSFDIFGAVMFIRIFLILRALRHGTRLKAPNARILSVMFNMKIANSSLQIKEMLRHNFLQFITLFFFASWAILGYIVYIFERILIRILYIGVEH